MNPDRTPARAPRADPERRPGATPSESGLLGPLEVRAIARALGIRPTKTLGQNFVHDQGTVRRIVRTAGVLPGDEVLEVGPGLGSLTLALLEAGARVRAVEIDPVLARALPRTVGGRMPGAAPRLRVVCADAMAVGTLADLDGPTSGVDGAGTGVGTGNGAGTGSGAGDGAGTGTGTADGGDATAWPAPTRLVANLPYNVAVPVLLTLLERFPSLTDVLVMVQAEVADRLAAGPGTRTYGVPSVKVAWYGSARRVGTVGRSVFWPAPNVDSALVHLRRRDRPLGDEDLRHGVFEVCDVAFGQRRKTLRAALRTWAGSPDAAESVLREAGIDPGARGETLDIEQFVALARAVRAARARGDLPGSPGVRRGAPEAADA